MTATTRFGVCLVLASSLAIAGCSAVFVTGAKEESPGRYDPAGCTTSRAIPSADAILTGANASAAVFALSRPDSSYQGGGVGREADVAVAVTATLAFAASAMYGFATVQTCRELTDRGRVVNPYQRAPARQTRTERLSDEAAEEAAVQARVREKEAADAKAAGEAAAHTSVGAKPAAPAR